MSFSKLPHAISSIVDHLWLVFQLISVAFPPSLLFVESSNNNDDNAVAPNGDLPGDDVLPQAVPAAALPPAPDAPALPAAWAPPVAAPPGAIAPRWPAIPVTLPFFPF